MQIKLSTGKSYGFSKAQLLQMKPNIQMGAIYLGQALTTFGQDRVKALSSYNWGIGSVKKDRTIRSTRQSAFQVRQN